MYDFLMALVAGVAAGIPIGHWISKGERRLEYERGKLEGINLWWPEYIKCRVENILRSNHQHESDKAAGSSSGTEQTIH